MGRWGDGEMGRWGDGEMGRWGDGEMGRWGDGEMGSMREIKEYVSYHYHAGLSKKHQSIDSHYLYL
ncbi:MAG: hypothetical protein F6K23_38825 [Okeania sp. SIO2C9]|uniref:hypothetical protein n=1 Tax=Okeania sp. SIO2C9 TaxID=2607791 RepID=UPI0013C0D2B9|nr:hypothetical protein [Okeania sp. SIO2C9]NEQ78426.1 hypothetical protein [Okeania sp. SIO2C9]